METIKTKRRSRPVFMARAYHEEENSVDKNRISSFMKVSEITAGAVNLTYIKMNNVTYYFRRDYKLVVTAGWL